jgi:dinuclear metal center YbgI/SA1388 family protein
MSTNLTAISLEKHLNELLDSSSFEDVCPNGIQITNTGEIKRVATAVSASLETIQKAIEWGTQALITHHGLFLNKTTVQLRGSLYNKVKLLLDNNIALLCYHLPLDAHIELGNNAVAARALGVTNLQTFGTFGKKAIGFYGTCNPIAPQELQAKLEKYYNHPAQVAVPETKKTITSIGFLSGGGHKFFPEAIKLGLDAFVTGTFDEPAWDQAQEENIAFYALSHTATEEIGPKALADYLAKTYDLSTKFIKTSNQF